MQKTLVFIILLLAKSVVAQNLSGEIVLSDKWESKLYILAIEDYQKNILIDSIEIAENGRFEYDFEDSNTLRGIFKIVLPPKGGNANYQVEGYNDNYFLFTIEDTSSTIVKAHADSLYYSIKITNSKTNERLLFYRDLKRPFYHLSLAIENAIMKNPESKDSINKFFIKKWMTEVYAYRKKLHDAVLAQDKDYMLLAGLYYTYYANAGQIDSVFGQTILDRVRINYALVRNTNALINSKQNNRLHTILANYKLKDKNLRTSDLYSIIDMSSEYHILYFWASWCRPCRLSNRKFLPEIVNEYSTNDFISISIDESQAKWLNANVTDNINWKSYWDYSTMIANSQHVSSVPLFIITNNNHEIIFETNNHYELENELRSLNSEKNKD